MKAVELIKVPPGKIIRGEILPNLVTPLMVEAARTDFASAGLPPDEFYADAFTSEADKAAT